MTADTCLDCGRVHGVTAGMDCRVIAYCDYDRSGPPRVEPAPCDLRGLCNSVCPFTTAEARLALRVCERHYPDWCVDERLIHAADTVCDETSEPRAMVY